MKYDYTEESPAGKKRLVFKLGDQEAIIIFELLQKAKHYMPRTPETRFDNARINDMYSTLQPLIEKLKKLDYSEN